MVKNLLIASVLGWCMGRLSLYLEDELNDRRRKREHTSKSEPENSKAHYSAVSRSDTTPIEQDIDIAVKEIAFAMVRIKSLRQIVRCSCSFCIL